MTLTTQGGPFVQTSAPEGVINLGLGQPSPRLLPLAAMATAAHAQLDGGDPLILQYGAMLGYEGFRRSLAGFLQREYGHAVEADALMVTGGISSALSLVSQVFARPGATVICEDPTYFLAHGVFASAGLQVRGVPVDAGGLRVDILQSLLAEGLRPAFVYCIPAYQNPSGACLDPARAEALLALAERYDFVVIADEPYVMLHYGSGDSEDGAGPGSLIHHDHGRGRVLSLGSFSKILAPGL
ncbi:MAG: PLP-dependent aminotransferase family protein, partial [Myxococcales bacterium]|nr:PLP-dependent aminotransferase family protein [Myxococcales bacterium]